MLIIDPNVLKTYPKIAIGVITVANAKNSEANEEITRMLRDAEQSVRNSMNVETFKEHPNIAAMQEVHKSFGNNPNKYPPSVQALCKRILKGGELPTINPIVDIYNTFSVKHVICIGAEDSDKCQGDIQLAYADGTEPFTLIGSEENVPPEVGELVYKDDAGVICRKLNWREGGRTQIDTGTRNCSIVVEGFPPFDRGEMEMILQEISETVEQFCGGSTSVHVLP